MNHFAQRLALVDAMGWTRIRRPDRTKCGPTIPEAEAIMWEYDFVPPQFKGDRSYNRPVPNFDTVPELRSLLEHLRDRGLSGKFMDHLRQMLNDANRPNPKWLGPTPFDYALAMTDPAKVRQAALLALGKWADQE